MHKKTDILILAVLNTKSVLSQVVPLVLEKKDIDSIIGKSESAGTPLSKWKIQNAPRKTAYNAAR